MSTKSDPTLELDSEELGFVIGAAVAESLIAQLGPTEEAARLAQNTASVVVRTLANLAESQSAKE